MERYDSGSGSLLRLPRLADFWINAQGTSVEAWPAPGLDHEACHQLYLNNVMPMALSRQGKLVLHASAVEVEGRALVFVGVSGRGKSTLATAFARRGYPLIVDDGLVVEFVEGKPMAMPGDRSVRLWRDSEQLLAAHSADSGQPLGYSEKRRIGASDELRFCSQPRPIQAIFLLGDDARATLDIRQLPPAQALIELIHYSFLLDVGIAERHGALMQAASRLAKTCGLALLDYTRDYEQLPQVHQAIFERVHALPQTA